MSVLTDEFIDEKQEKINDLTMELEYYRDMYFQLIKDMNKVANLHKYEHEKFLRRS